MNREYHRWWSERLNRDMELLVFGHAGAKVLVFPTRAARFHEYEDLGVVASLRMKIEAGHLQLFCVDSIDQESFYCYWAHPSGRIERHVQYEEYILNEVLPFIHRKNPHPCLIAHGLSFGAFHAGNIAFRHPHLFKKLAAFSGRYDLTQGVADFRSLLDGYYNDTVYYHTPTHFLPGLDCGHRLRHLKEMDIVLVIGEADPFRPNNEHLSHILASKGVHHHLHVWDRRAHNPHAWRAMAPLYL